MVQGQPVETRVFVDVKPSNYIVMSVITMLFFCFIFGLIALFMGLQVGRWGVVCSWWARKWVGRELYIRLLSS